MKNLILAVSILGSFAFPAMAENLCREEASRMGYVGAAELLPSCETPPNEQTTEKSNQEAGGAANSTKNKPNPNTNVTVLPC